MSPLENQLLRIWARLLEIDSIGPNDDFFELGGHSLLAVRLVTELETQLRTRIPLGMLIDGKVTIRGLARRIAAQRESLNPRPTPGAVVEKVVLNAEGDQPPVVILFTSRESLMAMRHLSVNFDRRHPLIGLLVGLNDDGRFPPSLTISKLAQDLVPTLRDLLPAGSVYRIAGYSLAGLIAYDLAGALAKTGVDVRWLGLIDTHVPGHLLPLQPAASILQRIRENGLRNGLRRRVRRIGSEWTVFHAEAVARLRHRPLSRFDELGARRLAGSHAPTGHSLPVDLFVAERSVDRGHPSLGWSIVHRGEQRMHRIDGDHLTMVQEPAARQLARAILASLTPTDTAGADRDSTWAARPSAAPSGKTHTSNLRGKDTFV